MAVNSLSVAQHILLKVAQHILLKVAQHILLKVAQHILIIQRKYEEEKTSKLKLNEELETLRQSYDEKRQQAVTSTSTIVTSDMLVLP